MLTTLGIEKNGISLDEKQVWMVTKKLCRHFKFPEPREIRFYGNDPYRGVAFRYSYRIKLAHVTYASTLIHELAHLYRYIKEKENGIIGRRSHTKKLMTVIKRFTKYCIKMNFWKKYDY
jgi:hypothetical protein